MQATNRIAFWCNSFQRDDVVDVMPWRATNINRSQRIVINPRRCRSFKAPVPNAGFGAPFLTRSFWINRTLPACVFAVPVWIGGAPFTHPNGRCGLVCSLFFSFSVGWICTPATHALANFLRSVVFAVPFKDRFTVRQIAKSIVLPEIFSPISHYQERIA